MSKPPKIVVPGLNRGAGIPAGYVLGRLPGTGHGPAQLLGLTGLKGMGIATTAGVAANNSDTLSRAHSETVSLSTAVSSGLSSAVSGTSSLSSAVSTVDSNQSTSLSRISSSLSGAISSTSSLSSAVSTVDSNQSTSISANLSKINSLSSAVGGGGVWGSISGSLSNQIDLQAALDAKLTVLDDSANEGAGAVRTPPGVIFFSIGDNSTSGTFSIGYAAAAGQLGVIAGDLQNFAGGFYMGATLDAANRVRCGSYGTVVGYSFDQDPYVTTFKIYHAGNLSFGTGLTYAGGVLTATGTGFETLDVDYTDAGNVTTAETDLFTYTITAGKLATNGDRAEAQWSGVFVSSGTATRQLRAYFGGTLIFDSGALTVSLAAAWDVFCTVTRVSATVVRYAISMTTEGAALAAYTSSGEVTGLTLSNTNVLKITGTAAGVGAATNDIVGKMGNVSYFPLSGGAINTSQSTSLSQISSSLSGAISSTSNLSTAVSTSLSTTNSTNVTQSTSLSQISSSLSGAISSTASLSTAVSTVDSNQNTSLSQISSSLSGAISSTSSLSTAVSTVVSGSISSANSRIDSLSTASGGGAAWALAGTGQTATGVYDFAVDGAKANIDFVGLASFNELLIIARDLTTGVSGQRCVRVSVDNGATFFAASGDYISVTAAGVSSNTSVMGIHDTNATAARTLITRIINLKGATKEAKSNTAGDILFVASASDINAIRVTNLAGGNITGGTVRVFAR